MPTDQDRLARYRAKRDFAATPEPAGGQDVAAGDEPDAGTSARGGGGRFVVHEHHATRLHWDLRLEHDGALASWAIPNGIPPVPGDNRLAVHTEDHPLDYLTFAGEIPKGEYGAGTITIWDTGTYETHEFSDEKVEVTFHGEQLNGRYGLFPIGHERDWMIHRSDPPDDPDRQAMPERVVPMLAVAGEMPRAEDGWSFEVKWDGVRALAYCRPGRLRLESRNLREITDTYPEIRGLLGDIGMHEALLDGEIVAFDDSDPPRPSFERLQRRMNVSSQPAVRRLVRSTPVMYAIFDLLYLDGHSLMELPYDERRACLEQLGLHGPAWRVPSARVGESGPHPPGRALLEATEAQGLEGVVAKRRDSRYEPGRRTGAWIKVKHVRSEELVIGGWLPGEGRRAERIGALLVGVPHDGDGGGEVGAAARLRYAGRVGTGFTERTLDALAARLAPLRSPESPFEPPPKLPRNAVYVRPELVAEVEFREWTGDGVMRAPSFKGLRSDKAAAEVVREQLDPRSPEALFGPVQRRPDGALAVTVDGRALKLTNWDKVLFDQTGFTKGDLIGYYARIAGVAVAHLRDRPLTLKRYPNGVDGQYFYEKQSPSHRPEWVPTVRVGGVDYTLCQDRATLVWLANLADIELHTSLSEAADADRPTTVVFDLDPGEGAGVVQCCQVALVLRGLFAGLGLQSVVKTSGSKGLQVYVPLNGPVTYAQTKPFARRVAEALEQRMADLVVSRMTKRLRPGRVLVDWSQNDAHKTTVSVYSVRARERPTVSTPVSWEEVRACHDARDPALLTFDTADVLDRVARDGDQFAVLLSTIQALPSGR